MVCAFKTAGFTLVLWCGVALAAEITLTVLHNNDVHGRFEEVMPGGSRCTQKAAAEGLCVGGIARQKTVVNRAKSINSRTLFLNAGDYYQGSLWYYLLGADIVVRAVNYLKHDAMTLGNHEFDKGPSAVAPLLQGSEVPILGCNVDLSGEPLLKGLPLRPSMMLNVAGQKIGLIGYLTPKTEYLSRPGKVAFTDEIQCIKAEATKLKREGANFIIAMGHSGVPKDIEIAKAVPEVGLVVGGHTHTFLYSGPMNGSTAFGDRSMGPYPIVVDRKDGTRCLVVQAFWLGKYMGYINVTYDDVDGHVLRWDGQPVLLDNSIPQDPDGLALLDEYRPLVAVKRAEKIGETKVHLPCDKVTCRLKECNLGNLITEAILKHFATLPSTAGSWSRVAAAIANSGGFRAPIDEQSTGGNVTFEDVVNVIPFGNTLVLVNLTGEQLKGIVEYGVSDHDITGATTHGEFLQMAGLRVRYDINRAPWDRVVQMEILCTACRIPRYEVVEPAKVYRIATISYMVNGGDNFDFSFVAVQDKYDTGDTDLDVVISYVKANTPITTGLDDRISFVETSAGHSSSASGAHVLSWFLSVTCAIHFSLVTIF
ncbi:protein 5NUC-like [Ornithodoros turicata]|uniref:protein 5NUC-like n=1 Tax=Ornithodoros turicata TaxID=34597 RepID=UPI0031390114